MLYWCQKFSDVLYDLTNMHITVKPSCRACGANSVVNLPNKAEARQRLVSVVKTALHSLMRTRLPARCRAAQRLARNILNLSISLKWPVTLHFTGYIWIETKHRDLAQIRRFEAEASVKCIRVRGRIKRQGTKRRDQRDWYVICALRRMEGS